MTASSRSTTSTFQTQNPDPFEVAVKGLISTTNKASKYPITLEATVSLRALYALMDNLSNMAMRSV